MTSPEAGIEYFPNTLRVLLEDIFVGKKAGVNVALIGQAVMQTTRLRVQLAPQQLGLGDSLHQHGFCCYYQEVYKFEHNIARSHGTDIHNLLTEFIQYAADNVDRNIHTLDGHDTFHGMGIIVGITPETNAELSICRANVTALDVAAVGRVHHEEERHKISAVTFQKLLDFKA